MNWEYKIEITETLGIEQLEKLGNEGWEHYAIDGNRHYFKKQKHLMHIEELNVSAPVAINKHNKPKTNAAKGKRANNK